jgi:hypothetical protein
MDDCCRIAELLLGGPPSGESGLTIGYLTIGSFFDLAVSAVYTANPLSGDGISIDVEYICRGAWDVARVRAENA